jgi:hypothetical protein
VLSEAYLGGGARGRGERGEGLRGEGGGVGRRRGAVGVERRGANRGAATRAMRAQGRRRLAPMQEHDQASRLRVFVLARRRRCRPRAERRRRSDRQRRSGGGPDSAPRDSPQQGARPGGDDLERTGCMETYKVYIHLQIASSSLLDWGGGAVCSSPQHGAETDIPGGGPPPVVSKSKLQPPAAGPNGRRGGPPPSRRRLSGGSVAGAAEVASGSATKPRPHPHQRQGCYRGQPSAASACRLIFTLSARRCKNLTHQMDRAGGRTLRVGGCAGSWQRPRRAPEVVGSP